MKIIVLKYGNLMGSPDLKKMMTTLGMNSPESDKLWDDLAAVKLAFGLNGQSSSVLLDEPARPDMFPALVDPSWLCADPASHTDASVQSALDAIAGIGVSPDAIRSVFITHPHGDHLDPRLLQRLPNAVAWSHPDSRIPGTKPIDASTLPDAMAVLDTPGHGTPHSSYIVDMRQHNLSVCIAGDLIMSHAHFLCLDDPASFSDHAAGRRSVRAVLDALASRTTKYRMILPGHDIPFFVP